MMNLSKLLLIEVEPYLKLVVINVSVILVVTLDTEDISLSDSFLSLYNIILSVTKILCLFKYLNLNMK